MVKKSKRKRESDSSTSSSSSDSSDTSGEHRNRHRNRDRHRHRNHKNKPGRDRKSKGELPRKRDGEEKTRKCWEMKKRNKGRHRTESCSTRSEYEYLSESPSDKSTERKLKPEAVLKKMLTEFPDVKDDLKQLLKMIDDGQAVDIKGISEKALMKHLRKLFLSLNLKEEDNGIFLLPSNMAPILEFVGPLIHSQTSLNENVFNKSGLGNDGSSSRRFIGPEMPSAELLAAAAKLTEAHFELRDAELEDDSDVFIGPAPPSVITEAESANEAERFEEVSRIMDMDDSSPYDVVGGNHKMSIENIKKRYWKLSLLVHPDKCAHPLAHQAFVKLNKSFKHLQDADKRNILDEKIKAKEEMQKFEIELQAMREAARWRRMQGISMEGDDELLAEVAEKVAPRRDEWMTELPPERQPGVTMHSTTSFSRSSKDGRGDASGWTDAPSDRATRAMFHGHVDAYSEATVPASDQERNRTVAAGLMDGHHEAKRSKPLFQTHREEVKRSKSRAGGRAVGGDGAEQCAYRPWDRERDLVAGRRSSNFDAPSLARGLSSRPIIVVGKVLGRDLNGP